MEFKGDILSHLLRIVTPFVIAELSTDSTGKQKKKLSDLVSVYCDTGSYESEEDDSYSETEQTEAKILPLNQDADANSESDEPKVVYQCGTRTHIVLTKFSEMCVEMEKNILGQKRPPKRKINRKTQAGTEYLLEQKKQYEKTNGMLKSLEVLSLYKQGARVTIIKDNSLDKSKKDKEDFHSDHERGVIINKKQA